MMTILALVVALQVPTAFEAHAVRANGATARYVLRAAACADRLPVDTRDNVTEVAEVVFDREQIDALWAEGRTYARTVPVGQAGTEACQAIVLRERAAALDALRWMSATFLRVRQ